MGAQTDFERLESIHDAFNKAVMDNFACETGKNGLAKFEHNLNVGEMFTLATAGLRYSLAMEDGYNYELKSIVLMDLADAAVPCLLRTFGEAAVLKAIPEDARNEETAVLMESYKSDAFAALIRKTC
ncbi:MAG TPA: hypothetical protein VIF12_06980 [Micavibrio sp.]